MKKNDLAVCVNFFKRQKRGKCNGKYCDSCLAKHYHTNVEELGKQKQWLCFQCTQTCQCAQCKRNRGINIPVKKRKRKKSMVAKLFEEASKKTRGVTVELKTADLSPISSSVVMEEEEKHFSPRTICGVEMLANMALCEPNLNAEEKEEDSAEEKGTGCSSSEGIMCQELEESMRHLKKEVEITREEMDHLKRTCEEWRRELEEFPMQENIRAARRERRGGVAFIPETLSDSLPFLPSISQQLMGSGVFALLQPLESSELSISIQGEQLQPILEKIGAPYTSY